MQEYVMFILNCKKYFEKRKMQKKTWLNKINFNYFHVIGDPEIEKSYIDYDQKIIYTKCEDNYESLPIKTYQSIKLICENFPDLKYIFKTDDDIIIDDGFFEYVFDTLKNNPDSEYFGYAIDIHKNKYSEYHIEKVEKESSKKPVLMMKKTTYASGKFYIIKKTMLDKILNFTNVDKYFESNMFEDYAVGYLIKNLDGNLVRINLSKVNEIV